MLFEIFEKIASPFIFIGVFILSFYLLDLIKLNGGFIKSFNKIANYISSYNKKEIKHDGYRFLCINCNTNQFSLNYPKIVKQVTAVSENNTGYYCYCESCFIDSYNKEINYKAFLEAVHYVGQNKEALGVKEF